MNKLFTCLLFLMAALGLHAQSVFPATANRIVRGSGAPSSGTCMVAADVGKVYINLSAAASNSTFYVCANTAAMTYGWELTSGGSAGTGCIPGGSAGQLLTSSGAGACTAQGQVTVTANTLTLGATGKLDASAASVTAGLKLPSAAAAAPTADGFIAVDTTAHTLKYGSNGSSKTVVDTGVTTLSSLVSVGTISTGTWSATAIANSKGGTGGDSSASSGIAHVSAGTWSYSSIVNADITNGTIAAAKLIGTDIATVGTVTSGTWNATTIALNHGGTGATTQQAAYDAIAPTATRAGDITYWNGTHYVNLGGNASGTNCFQEDNTGAPSWAACGSGSGTVTVQGGGSLNTNGLVSGGSATAVQTPSSNATLDGSGNLSATSLKAGTSTPTCTAGTGGTFCLHEGTAVTGEASADNCYADSTKHGILCSNNNGTALPLVQGPASSTSGNCVQFNNANGSLLSDSGSPCGTGSGGGAGFSGTVSLGTSAISSGACATVVTSSQTGMAGTDSLIWSFNSDPTAVTGYSPATAGMLTIISYPTTNTANFKVCNNTGSSITPGAITLNFAASKGAIATGTSALGTSAISSGACATVVTTSATGTATTSSIAASFNADPTGVTGYSPTTNGMLTIIGYPTSDNVNFKVCNNTTASVTPGAITLNWRVF